MSKEIMMGTLKHNIVALPVILLYKWTLALLWANAWKLICIKKLTCYVSGVLLAYEGLMRGLDFWIYKFSLNEKSHLLDGCDMSIKT